MKQLGLAILLATFFLAGCRKYPEDSFPLHLKRPEKRIWKHHLFIDEFRVDGVDSIPLVNSKLSGGRSISEYEMDYNHHNEISSYYGGHLSIFFENHCRSVRIKQYVNGSAFPYPIFFEDENTWVIKRLDKYRMVIELVKNNKTYRIGLKITKE